MKFFKEKTKKDKSDEAKAAKSNSFNTNQGGTNSPDEYIENALNSYSNEFNKDWDASMIIDYIVELAQIGNHCQISLNQLNIQDDTPYNIKMRRLLSVLDFYKKGIFYEFNNQAIFDGLLSEERDSDKINEIRNLIRKLSSCKESEVIISLIEKADDFYEDLSFYFNELISHYIKLMKLKDIFRGVLECSNRRYCALESIKKIYDNNFEETLKDMKALIILLMGDDYDERVSERELIEKCNYPNITDRQLMKLEIDWA